MVGRNDVNGVTGAAEVSTVAVDSIEIGAPGSRNRPSGHLHFHHGNADGILGVAGFQISASTSTSRDRVSVLESNGKRPATAW